MFLRQLQPRFETSLFDSTQMHSHPAEGEDKASRILLWEIQIVHNHPLNSGQNVVRSTLRSDTTAEVEIPSIGLVFAASILWKKQPLWPKLK